MADLANHVFLPWVQPGVAANIPSTSIDKLGTAVQPSVINMQVQVTVNAEPPVNKAVRLVGPGDVTGIDPHQVIRTEPKPNTGDFEPNYFASIEFDRPDFPWLFSPLKADAQGRLRPWMCLIVVRKQDGVTLAPAGAAPLPTLNIIAPAQPASELPDLSESWAWAHVQLTSVAPTVEAISGNLASDPTRNVSRLLCPRKLEPSTSYIACVVPTFEVGRKTGLGIAVAPAEETKLDPAWTTTPVPLQVTLPVYYSWEFRTGVGGDFEELVRRLEPRELPPDVGKRPMDVSQPGFPLDPQPAPGSDAALVGLEGALRVLGNKPDDWVAATRTAFQNVLMPMLNLPHQLSNPGTALSTSASTPATSSDPIVAPPIYGQWHAAQREVSNAPPPAPQPAWPPLFWLNELNLDPRHRVAAGLGTQVIQAEQEQLMASAWAQLGDIQRINQRKRQAQLSRAINEKLLNKSFARMPDEAFLKVVAPAQSRILLDEGPATQPTATRTPLIAKLAPSVVPTTTVSAPLRKLLRPRGSISKQYTAAQLTAPLSMIGFFNTTTPPAVPDRSGVTIDKIADALLSTDPLRTMIRLAAVSSASITAVTRPQTPAVAAFKPDAIAHWHYLETVFPRLIFIPIPLVVATSSMKSLAMASLDPSKTVVNAVMATLSIGSPPLQTGDPLDPVMDAPTFPQPMYEALCDLSQDYLLPGIEHVPPNTVQLLQTNAKFIESFMVGLNTEMGRELLWRDYPTDQRGTYFKQFWDTAAAGVGPIPDIPPITQWGAKALGANSVGPGGDRIVLIIRGELLRRYPNTVIYASRAGLVNGKPAFVPSAEERHPIFRGSLEPDITFVGFNLSQAEVAASPSWYFVLQEQPTEPRFGMDDPFDEHGEFTIPPLTDWNHLAWSHVAPSPAAFQALTHVSVNKVMLTPTTKQTAVWRQNGAHMALITKQLPVRVAIHASQMVPSIMAPPPPPPPKTGPITSPFPLPITRF